MAPTKFCLRCDIEKPLAEFHRSSSAKDGIKNADALQRAIDYLRDPPGPRQIRLRDPLSPVQGHNRS